MSKESSIKVICWSLKYARTCFRARLGEPHSLPEAEQMKAPVLGWGRMEERAGHCVSLTRWLQFRMGEPETNPEAASCFTWKPVPLACPDQGPKGIFSLESRPERMEPEEGVIWKGCLIHVTCLCVATSSLIMGRE